MVESLTITVELSLILAIFALCILKFYNLILQACEPYTFPNELTPFYYGASLSSLAQAAQMVTVSVYNVGDPGLIPGSGRSPGEGNGNPLQYYCLENSTNRGAWQATVHGITKSQT